MKRISTQAGCFLRILFVIVSLPALMLGQGARGQITGVVKDSSGALIPGAIVTVRNENTGLATSTVTQATGAYLIPGLTPGDYQVTAEVAGFKKLAIEGLKIDVGTTLTQDLMMEVGTVTEVVEVKGVANLVETTSGAVGTTVEMTHVLEIPVPDRNVYSLINLVPASFLKHRFGPAGNHLD